MDPMYGATLYIGWGSGGHVGLRTEVGSVWSPPVGLGMYGVPFILGGGSMEPPVQRRACMETAPQYDRVTAWSPLYRGGHCMELYGSLYGTFLYGTPSIWSPSVRGPLPTSFGMRSVTRTFYQ